MELNFNAIAQGYTSDRIADYLHSIGVRDMLVDIGEIYCEGVNQKGNPWSIGIDRPIDGNMTPGADLDGIWKGDGSGRSPGAEKLIGRGDMLYYAGVEMERVQCALIDSDEINKLTEFVGSQQGYKKSYNTPYYLPDVEEATEDGSGGMVDMKNLDERFEEAARMIVMNQRGSTSDLQRRLGMGYAKAGRVMDQLEAAGIVGPQEGSKPRQVLISSLEELEKVLEAFRNQ